MVAERPKLQDITNQQRSESQSSKRLKNWLSSSSNVRTESTVIDGHPDGAIKRAPKRQKMTMVTDMIRSRALAAMGIQLPTTRTASDSEIIPRPEVVLDKGGMQAMCTSRNSDPVYIGCEDGIVLTLNLGRSHELIRKPRQALGRNTVRALSVYDSNETLCVGTDAGVIFADCSTGKEISNVTPMDDVGFRVVEAGPAGQFLAGTRSGNLYLVDSREAKVIKSIKNLHSPKVPGSGSTRKTMRVSGAITGATWLSNTTFATSSNLETTVRFWDLRNTKQSFNAVETNPQRTQSRKRGIASIISDVASRVWSFDNSGRVVASMAAYDTVVGAIEIPDEIDSSGQGQIALVDSGARSSYLAFSTLGGVSFAPIPTLRDTMLGLPDPVARERRMHMVKDYLGDRGLRMPTDLVWNRKAETLVGTSSNNQASAVLIWRT